MAVAQQKSEESTEVLTVLKEELSFARRIVVCAVYICGWRIKNYIRYDRKLNRGAKVTVAVAALILLPEGLLFVLERFPEFAESSNLSTAAIIEHYVPSWLGPIALVVLVVAATLLTLHKIAEAVKAKKERSLAVHFEPLADALTELVEIVDAKPQDREQAMTGVVTKLLTQVHEDFEKAKGIPVTINVMSKQPDGKLRIAYLFPVGTPYDPNICFDPGQGGAGFSFAQNAVVYVPSIAHMHGIIVKVSSSGSDTKIEYGLKRRVYMPISEEFEVFKSFVCLPVTSKRDTHGVLNVDSKNRDAFDMDDVHVLRAYARVLGDAISLLS